MPEPPRISVVIPVLNEEDSVDRLVTALREALDSSFELIFVDDGSTDATWTRLKTLHESGCVRLVRFRRNFGKTAALMAGFHLTRGDVVITMDGDLQDDPSEIPRFVSKIKEGYDLVSGWKRTRHDPWHKVAASRIFNFVVAWVTGLRLHDINCGFKAYRGDLARSLRLHGEMHRFIPVIVAAQGLRVAEIEVTHHARKYGRSKYGFARLFKGCFDLVTVSLLTRFRERPAHLFGFASLPFFAAALVLALSGIFPLYVLAGVFWISGVILLAAGWVAEMVAGLAAAGAGQTPLYSIEEQLD